MKALLEALNIEASSALSGVLDALLAVVVIIVLLFIIKRAFAKIEKRAAQRGDPVTYLRAIRYVITALTIIIGGIAVFSNIPALNNILVSLLASSGVAALVISVAAQDAISNFVGGVIIGVSKPFKVGDTIRFIDKDTTGVVEKITIRHTVIRTFENKRVIIPNGTINNSVIENITYGDVSVTMFLEVGFTYESDIERAMELFAEAVMEQPGFIDQRSDEDKEKNIPAVSVLINRFEPSAIVLRCAVSSPNLADSSKRKSNIYLSLTRKIIGENVSFAYPHMRVVGK